MSNHVLVLRAFSGLQPGQVLDATDWKHTMSLEEDRYLRRLDKIDAASAEDCPCGIGPVLAISNLHTCEQSLAAKVEAAKEKVAEKKAEEPAAAAPAAPAPSKATAGTRSGS